MPRFAILSRKVRTSDVTKLHIGCGPQILQGWINIDNAEYPGVDRVLDVTTGLPFEDVSYIFAEHFIEHLAYTDAAQLMRECRRVLRDDGVLRLSTPNLDWVWFTHYKLEMTEEEQVRACFELNRAFRGWGHQFLYNERTLGALLQDAGFANIMRVEYGVSTHAELHGKERHELSPGWGSLSSILIVEASGRGGKAPDYVEAPRAGFLRDVGLK
jgi:predicted SAM-dependent methyltransferase